MGTSANVRETSIMNQSIAMGTRGRGDTTSAFRGSRNQSKAQDRSRVDLERDPNSSGFGKAVEKKITTTSNNKSKMQSEISPLLQNRSKMTSQTPNEPPTQQIIQPVQIIQRPIEEQLMEEKQEYVKIGDIVCLEFMEQIFEGLREYAKIDGGQDNLRLARILEKPDFVYKGVIHSDGIVEKDFKIIPKNIRLGIDKSFTEQKKSIFRIEVEQDFKFTQQYNELKEEMAINEVNEYENPDEEEEKLSIYRDIKKKYKKELKANLSEQKFHSGKNLLYGQVVQFRHIASGLFLTLETKKLSNEFGCFEIKLSSCNEYSRFKLMPSQTKTKAMSEPVEYEDNFIIQNVKESTGYYLH